MVVSSLLKVPTIEVRFSVRLMRELSPETPLHTPLWGRHRGWVQHPPGSRNQWAQGQTFNIMRSHSRGPPIPFTTHKYFSANRILWIPRALFLKDKEFEVILIGRIQTGTGKKKRREIQTAELTESKSGAWAGSEEWVLYVIQLYMYIPYVYNQIWLSGDLSEFPGS